MGMLTGVSLEMFDIRDRFDQLINIFKEFKEKLEVYVNMLSSIFKQILFYILVIVAVMVILKLIIIVFKTAILVIKCYRVCKCKKNKSVHVKRKKTSIISRIRQARLQRKTRLKTKLDL
ncbi:hypothetical protein [Joinjakaka virus]|uniref:Uncharacterized protein n=1 Tax=Joinjakaka virus TaxID=1272943 RepID=A0A0D3R1D5_9RHAB|nr:hypothetical protein [Joinjakaka virus]AJR28539.1 hypothetical protein [Joinjakaka virus]